MSVRMQQGQVWAFVREALAKAYADPWTAWKRAR
jgi:hypothetical protein